MPCNNRLRIGLAAILLVGIVGETLAGGADVEDVSITKTGDNFRFDVTIRHADTGWQHYADKWEIVTKDGQVLGTRILYHPHVNEQPFTRSLGGVKIPPDVRNVSIRAYDNRHGRGGKIRTISVPH
ncbi:MAG: hypothetical protein ACR2PG_24150 [Hyphomicrobiaceae bacterium]